VGAPVAGLALAAAAAGCGVPHPGINNGAVSGCFRAIPTARADVHNPNARMVDVDRLAADKAFNRLSPQTPTTADLDTSVCAVVFEGTFDPGQVELAPPTASGHYAIVLVTDRTLTVVGAYLANHPPGNLGAHLPPPTST
jgi:hypothetical protein